MEAQSDAPRPPLQADLVSLCRELNRCGARYLVVGGMAIIQQGFVRATDDVDLLIESSADNRRRVLAALATLPDGAVREMRDDDLDRYTVVRVADEIVVDLMLSACGVRYEECAGQIETRIIQGVEIPFASAALLLRLKQTAREKDALDRRFLQAKLRGEC